MNVQLRLGVSALLAGAILLAANLGVAAKPQSSKTMTVEFREKTSSKTGKKTSGKATVIEGKLYFQSPRLITLVISSPVDQWVVFDEKQTTIYYPTTKEAFKYGSQGFTSSPYTQPFSGLLAGDLGLSRAGFKLARKEVSKGHLTMYWTPPAAGGKTAGDLVVDMVDDQVASLSIRDQKGRVLVESTFSDYVRHKSIAFPMHIENSVNIKGTKITKTITFTNARFDVDLPESVEHFELPKGTNIR